jgi:hypothetical protein
MSRVCLYVDGFNVYHALDIKYPHLKWLNYWKLAESVLQAQDRLVEFAIFLHLSHGSRKLLFGTNSISRPFSRLV